MSADSPAADTVAVLDGLMRNKAVYLHRGLETKVHDRAIGRRLYELPAEDREFLADGGPEYPV